MERNEFLHKYQFNWPSIDIVVEGVSPLDTQFFFARMRTRDEVKQFLKGYGFDCTDPVALAELFGTFQESLQFVKRYFLKEGNPEGFDLKIPNSLYMMNDVVDLFVMAQQGLTQKDYSKEEALWAQILFKIMHTILHVDKDLRVHYYSEIQTQIFDRFYKYINRDSKDRLFLGTPDTPDAIRLHGFEAKAKKPRDSVIIKLLHKEDYVGEEVFDRIGVRLVCERRFDTLRVLKFLIENNIVIPHNVKSSRSLNSLFDMKKFRGQHYQTVKRSMRENWGEEQLRDALVKVSLDCLFKNLSSERNTHTLKRYQAIQFTCRQLIRYQNPFLQEYARMRKQARELRGNDLQLSAQTQDLIAKVLSLDTSTIAGDVRFFYPFEVQITDLAGHKCNTEGKASHIDYKKSQIRSAMIRTMRPLLEHKEIQISN